MAKKSDPKRRRKMRAYAPGHVKNKTAKRKAKRKS